MSKETWADLGKDLRQAGIEVCWRQWAALGAPVWRSSRRAASAVIDLEALLLLSGAFTRRERRLDDLMTWWGVAGSRLVSVQRFRVLSRLFPPDAAVRVQPFISAAIRSSDPRWKRDLIEPVPKTRSAEIPGEPRLRQPPALMARVRAGFGVGVKSDLLTYLIARNGSPQSVQQIQSALGYSRQQLSRSCREVSQAGFIQKIAGRPARYLVDASRWAAVLQSAGTPTPSSGTAPAPSYYWRFWPGVYAFLGHVDRWLDDLESGGSAYLLSSEARDLFLDAEEVVALNGISAPDPSSYRGEEYMSAFATTLRLIIEWLDSES